MQASSERTYLVVPYAEKDQAKAWFAPGGTELAPLSAWLPPVMSFMWIRVQSSRGRFVLPGLR